jgi:hypothetical protein
LCAGIGPIWNNIKKHDFSPLERRLLSVHSSSSRHLPNKGKEPVDARKIGLKYYIFKLFIAEFGRI